MGGGVFTSLLAREEVVFGFCGKKSFFQSRLHSHDCTLCGFDVMDFFGKSCCPGLLPALVITFMAEVMI